MEANSKNVEEHVHSNGYEKQECRTKIFWRNVIWYAFLHLTALYGFYLMFTSATWKTSFFGFTLERVSFLGITAGAHRLWSHRSYKASGPLRVFLCILNTVAFQNDIYVWCRDHRVHHKFTETDADPHNIKRGFFFAHIGWLLCRKHPEVAKKGKTIFAEDLMADPIVRVQRRFYIPLVLFFCFCLPTMIPVWCWGETVWNSFFIAVMARYCVSLNSTWLVNSAAHKYGDQPFDKCIEARENPVVALLTEGEGWHNYHHVFPWDYAASELGYTLNLTKVFIDVMAMIGLACDLKTANPNAIKDKKLKSGDGTRVTLNEKRKILYTPNVKNK